MKKLLKVLIAACVCSLAVFAIVGCGQQEVSRSSESLEVESEETVTVDTSEPIYVLAIGNDSRWGTSEQKKVKEDDPTYSDTIMLLRLDVTNNRIGILSVPRDTAATLADGTPEKINAVHLTQGPEALAKEVGDMFGVKVNYYFDLKFIDFAALVDKIGTVYNEIPMSISGKDIISGNKISVDAGPNDLDGAHALLTARLRKVYANDGEAVRQMISRDMVANTIQRIAALPSDGAKSYADMLMSVSETNMTEDELTAYVEAFMDNSEPIAFNTGTAPYSGGIDETGTWRISRDPDTYAALAEALENGGDMTEIVPLPYV